MGKMEIKGKKVIQPITKEDLTSTRPGCYGKQVEFHSGSWRNPWSKLHRSEGDINISPRRQQWQDEHLNDETRALLAEDEKYFLKQALSTPCLNAMRACDGIWIEDLQGRRYMDFHGTTSTRSASPIRR